MRAARFDLEGCRPHSLTGALVLSLLSCRGTDFLALPSLEPNRALAHVELGLDGALLGSSPISDASGGFRIELSGRTDTRVLVFAFAPEDFGELDRVAALAGLDGPNLTRTEDVQPAGLCAPTYPGAREVFEYAGESLNRIDELNPDEIPQLTAPWLLGACAPIEAPPEGFVDSVAISSTCDACPSTQIDRYGPCQMRLRTAPTLCSSTSELIELSRDWRGDVCVLDSKTCTQLGERRIECGLANERCELGFSLGDLTEADRFAVSEVVVETSVSLAENTVASTALLPLGDQVVLASARFARLEGRCETGFTTKLRFYGLVSRALEHEVELPECVVGLVSAPTDATFLAIAVEDGRLFQIIELDPLGREHGRLRFGPGPWLGLDAGEVLFATRSLWWPALERYVIGFASPESAAASGVLASFAAVSGTATVTTGPSFGLPGGSPQLGLMSDGPAGPGLYLSSGGAWAQIDNPIETVQFASLGQGAIRAPAIREFGVFPSGAAWLVGQAGQTGVVMEFEPSGRVRAVHSETSGDARFLTPWTGGHALLIAPGVDGTYGVRFDPERWSFVPGTLRLSAPGMDTKENFGGAVRARDGSIWLSYRDGRLLRVAAP